MARIICACGGRVNADLELMVFESNRVQQELTWCFERGQGLAFVYFGFAGGVRRKEVVNQLVLGHVSDDTPGLFARKSSNVFQLRQRVFGKN